MKIGILTFFNAVNYGAVLQCYALLHTIKKLRPTDTVEVVDYRCKNIERSYAQFVFDHFAGRSFVRNFLSFARQTLYACNKTYSKKVFAQFVEKYLNIAKQQKLNDFDIIVYDSDQIWNSFITGNDTVFLGKGFTFAKIAYGASDGEKLEFSQKEKDLIKDFFAVSCREKSLLHRMQVAIPKIDATCVLDPTFLLESDVYKKIATPVKDKNYILVYKLSENNDIEKEAVALGKKLNKKVIQLCYMRSIKSFFRVGIHYKTAVSPLDFLGYFEAADMVLTTSFHGTAFSLIFRKPFAVFQFTKNNNRIIDLLSDCGLQTQWVKSVKDAVPTSAIYTKEFEDKFLLYRQNSLLFLESALNKARTFATDITATTFDKPAKVTNGGGYKCIVVLRGGEDFEYSSFCNVVPNKVGAAA